MYFLLPPSPLHLCRGVWGAGGHAQLQINPFSVLHEVALSLFPALQVYVLDLLGGFPVKNVSSKIFS